MKLLKYILIAIVFAATTGEAFGQAKVLSGKVTEMFGTTAEPMIGVNVNILNSQNRSLGGTVTNLDGIYNLPIPNENNLIIVFSYIGKKSERIKYNGQTRLNVVLKDDTQTINEVVVQGKRIERNDLGISAREQSSATQKVSMEDLVAVAPVTSIEDALQGQLGGVDIVLGGGDPGARASIQIRGGSTLNANAEPLIVVDGVFSMEGDIANLPEIVRLSKKYDANIMVDEAHGLGVLGNHGRGTCDHFGLTKEVDLIMGTFSKSLAAIGGFIAADESIINYLRHNSRSYIFSASNTPAATAAARAALQIMKNEPERIEHLWDITNYSLKCFRELGFEIGHTSTPIIPLYVRDMEKTFMVTKMLFDEGVFVNPVVPPACSPNDTLIRFSLMATHSKEQIDFAIGKLVKCFKALDLL